MLRFGSYLLVAAVLFAPQPAHAQAARSAATAPAVATLPAACAEKLIPYAAWHKVDSPVFSLDLAAAAQQGRLRYLGAEHSTDPAHAQFAEIERAWDALKPSIAFYEGPNRPVAATRDETIKAAGESGFVRFLAARDGVPYVSLEPSPVDEVNYVSRKFTAEQVTLFFVLRETARLRERRNMAEPQLRAAVAQLLERAAKMKLLTGPVNTLDELDAAYKRHWKDGSQWWQAPSAWFDPLKSSADTGGIFTNELNAMSSGYRDLHMYRLLAQAALEGKRAFAVVGRNHVAMQADALRCALK